MILRRLAVIVFLVATAAVAAVAADEPHLPDAGPPIGPLRRGADGAIEVIGPAAGHDAGPARCDRRALCVGKGERYASLAAALALARDGDLVELAGGLYRESATIARRDLTLRGIGGRPHIDCAGVALAGDRACLFLAAAGIVLDNLEISGAAPAASDAAAACVANAPGIGFRLRRIFCHGAENGLLAAGGTVVIEDSEFYDNGWTAGSSNLALDGGCIATIRGTIVRDARHGDELLSRCSSTEITDSTVTSSAGLAALDLPAGGDAMIYRSIIEKGRDAGSDDILRFATASCRHPGNLVLKDVRIVNAAPDAALRNADHCLGGAIVLEQVTVTGPALRRFGYVIER